ncbi:MAG: glycosyltransferase family 2 protein, partial [Planktothrix sp.]
LDKFFAHVDLSEHIQHMESQVRYHTLVWFAWYHYDQGFYGEMAQFLNKALEYTPYYRAETISDWVKQFKQFSIQSNLNLDICFLTDLSEWHNLIVKIMN